MMREPCEGQLINGLLEPQRVPVVEEDHID